MELSDCVLMTSFRANILARVLPRWSSKAIHLEAQDAGGLTMRDAEFEHLVKVEITLIFLLRIKETNAACLEAFKYFLVVGIV